MVENSGHTKMQWTQQKQAQERSLTRLLPSRGFSLLEKQVKGASCSLASDPYRSDLRRETLWQQRKVVENNFDSIEVVAAVVVVVVSAFGLFGWQDSGTSSSCSWLQRHRFCLDVDKTGVVVVVVVVVFKNVVQKQKTKLKQKFFWLTFASVLEVVADSVSVGDVQGRVGVQESRGPVGQGPVVQVVQLAVVVCASGVPRVEERAAKELALDGASPAASLKAVGLEEDNFKSFGCW